MDCTNFHCDLQVLSKRFVVVKNTIAELPQSKGHIKELADEETHPNMTAVVSICAKVPGFLQLCPRAKECAAESKIPAFLSLFVDNVLHQGVEDGCHTRRQTSFLA